MDAIGLIKENIDVELILKHYGFEEVKQSGNYLRACCKIHEGDNSSSFVIHYDEGLWSCHTGDCGSGDIFTLVQKLEKTTFPYAVHKIAEILGLDLTNMEIVARTKKERREVNEFLSTLKKHNKEEQEEYFIPETHKNVKKYKEFKKETMEYFGLKFYHDYSCDTFDLSNVLGFPIVQNGKIVGISIRTTLPNSKFKWIHQPNSIKTSELLYNYDNVLGEKEIVIVEGITDAWAYHEIGVKAVATYGAKISQEQKRMLLRTGADLIFSFDGDEAGENASRKAYQEFRLTSNIWFIDIPEGKDPENISREELLELYVKRRR